MRVRRHEADAIASRVSDALSALGVRPASLHLEETRQGLLIVAAFGDRKGACVLPSGNQVTYDEVAKTLLGDAKASLNAFVLPTQEREACLLGNTSGE
jgi:hypothetical protein